jgi:hypothetical protein
MVLGWTSKSTNIMTMFFNEWEKICDDGFGYYIKTSGGYEYVLKAPHNSIYKSHSGIRTFMLHCRQKTSGTKEDNSGEENHPFLSEDNRFLLTHNGCVTSMDKMKEILVKKGHKFKTVVDSEFLLHSFEDIISDRQISEKIVEEWIRTLNTNGICGTINVIVLDRTTNDWFAYSDGSIEVMKPIESNDLFVGTNSIPFGNVPIFTMKISTGDAIFGNKSKITRILGVGKVGWQAGNYGYTNTGWQRDSDDYWSRVVEYNKRRQGMVGTAVCTEYGTMREWDY